MAKTKHSCPNCGADVLKVRWDAGYRYCKARECFEALGRRDHVPTHEPPPDPDSVDVTLYDFDDVADLYGSGE